MTIVDRSSRINLIADLPGGRNAQNMQACCIDLFERVPVQLRRSLTWDSQNVGTGFFECLDPNTD